MNNKSVMASFLAVMLTHTLCSASFGGTRSYNINVLLNEPHPYSSQLNDPDLSKFFQMPVPVQNIRAPARIPGFQPPSRAIARVAIKSNRLSPAIVLQPQRPVTPLREKQNGNIVSEIRLGMIAHDHDIAPFSRSEEGGVDANLEILFISPSWLEKIRAPRPHMGFSINASGDTSQAYMGLTWEWRFWNNWFFDFSLGGAIHDGKTTTTLIDRKELGCRVLFRESLDLGYIFSERHSISAFLDHISNAKLCEKNEALETLGIRYGYRF